MSYNATAVTGKARSQMPAGELVQCIAVTGKAMSDIHAELQCNCCDW